MVSLARWRHRRLTSNTGLEQRSGQAQFAPELSERSRRATAVQIRLDGFSTAPPSSVGFSRNPAGQRSTCSRRRVARRAVSLARHSAAPGVRGSSSTELSDTTAVSQQHNAHRVRWGSAAYSATPAAGSRPPRRRSEPARKRTPRQNSRRAPAYSPCHAGCIGQSHISSPGFRPCARGGHSTLHQEGVARARTITHRTPLVEQAPTPIVQPRKRGRPDLYVPSSCESH